MKISKTYRYLAYTLITSLLLGLLCNFFYDRSPKQSLNIRAFAAELAKKENAADQTLKQLTQIINYKSVDSLSNYKFSDNDIFYFVFEKNELLFWSDNHIEPTEITTFDSIRWHYNKLSNAHCIAKSRITDSKILMAVILLKYNYPYENKDLINSYSKGFNLDKRIEIVEGRKKILIGARSALFCPVDNLGLVIVDEEHEASFKQDEKLKYNGRDCAVMLAHFNHCPVVLGSATPSLETWNNAQEGKYKLHSLKQRVADRPTFAQPSLACNEETVADLSRDKSYHVGE